ncbi:protein kinase [Histoplasma capsulatum H143]|uniref:Protein kinase n=1 Tax=Ajellomyces capsulatus (strain H143) TaxID=544712 RepID=C6H7Z1_AJECH|nr:protein kinase [Histoplasma capsulatum H143]
MVAMEVYVRKDLRRREIGLNVNTVVAFTFLLGEREDELLDHIDSLFGGMTRSSMKRQGCKGVVWWHLQAFLRASLGLQRLARCSEYHGSQLTYAEAVIMFAFKVYVHTSLIHRELPFYHHISRRMVNTSHRGRNNIWRLLDSFEAVGLDGKHIVLVLEIAQMSLRDMKLALDFLHTHGEVAHTDIHPGNLLLGVYDSNLMQKLEQKEFESPVPRKPELLHSNRRFTARDGDGGLYDASYLAQRIASPGLPPLEFLNKNLEKKADFWDEQAILILVVDDAYARELACVLLLSQYPRQWKPSILNWRIRRLFFGFFEGL